VYLTMAPVSPKTRSHDDNAHNRGPRIKNPSNLGPCPKCGVPGKNYRLHTRRCFFCDKCKRHLQNKYAHKNCKGIKIRKDESVFCPECGKEITLSRIARHRRNAHGMTECYSRRPTDPPRRKHVIIRKQMDQEMSMRIVPVLESRAPAPCLAARRPPSKNNLYDSSNFDDIIADPDDHSSVSQTPQMRST